MEEITKDQTIKECSEVLGHQIENKPLLDTSKIILVSETNPKLLRRTTIHRSSSNSSSTNSVIYQPPSTKDFYLTGCGVSYQKDAGSTLTEVWIQTTLNGGQTQYLTRLAGLTGTAGQAAHTFTFRDPLKIDRGAAMILFCDSFNANQKMVGFINGYEVDIEPTRI